MTRARGTTSSGSPRTSSPSRAARRSGGTSRAYCTPLLTLTTPLTTPLQGSVVSYTPYKVARRSEGATLPCHATPPYEVTPRTHSLHSLTDSLHSLPDSLHSLTRYDPSAGHFAVTQVASATWPGKKQQTNVRAAATPRSAQRMHGHRIAQSIDCALRPPHIPSHTLPPSTPLCTPSAHPPHTLHAPGTHPPHTLHTPSPRLLHRCA